MPKALRSRVVARDPEHELAAARTRYEANDLRGSLARLNRARRLYAKRGDTAGLQRVLEFAENADMPDDHGRAMRDNLVYAAKQNIRGTTRRDALRAGLDWTDPYPDLSAPEEHTRIPMTRGVKFWIGVGVVIGALAVGAYFAALAIFGLNATKKLHVRVRNNTSDRVLVEECDTPRCPYALSKHTVPPNGSFADTFYPKLDSNDLYVIYRGDRRVGCLPIRTRAAYDLLRDKNTVVHLFVSQMTPCPGTPIVPTP